MTDSIKPISDSFSAAGQVSADDLQQAAAQGFKSVLNLRSPDEPGFSVNEQHQAEAAGLDYTNVPLNPSQAEEDKIATALAALEALPQPTLIHCAAGARAGAIALIATATQAKLTAEEVIIKAQQAGLNPEQPHLHQFVESLRSESTPDHV
ncbi:MAG TPA: sulfur transferase domain-containing protein [Trichocoleus sp.]|jgi:uncharacterized protein (TIGR01244 family)